MIKLTLPNARSMMHNIKVREYPQTPNIKSIYRYSQKVICLTEVPYVREVKGGKNTE